MGCYPRAFSLDAIRTYAGTLRNKGFHLRTSGLGCFLALMVVSSGAMAQVDVLTAHNDIARTGQNLQETILTPSTISGGTFGKLFSHLGINNIPGQPLYVSQVNIPGEGVHNVVYVASGGDVVYAFDADNDGGINGNPLWQASLLTNTAPAGTYSYRFGVVGTPVIDLSSNTMYLVSSESTTAAPVIDVFRLHALDITTGAEKFGGPVQIQASVPGTGTGSSNGTLVFDPEYELQRPGLLLLNGVVYVAFGSIGDNGPWHGWLFSFNAVTLQQIDVFCTTPNGSGAGIWMGGSGLAAEVNDSTKPYGRMFLSTGNGSYSATAPYTPSMSYGMSVLDLDLTGGTMTVQDEFTPFNQALLDGQDGDLGSGGVVLLPAQTLASGKTLSPLVQIGKSGMIYILDRNNLGGYNGANDQILQEVQTPPNPDGADNDWGAGVWGSSGYWNQKLYFGGTNSSFTDSFTQYSFLGGALSETAVSQTDLEYSYPGPTPSISANGATNGIVWVINSREVNVGDEVLLAYDASNLASLLYSSNANLTADDPGGAVKYAVPTVANGKVYVGAAHGLDVYGLLGTIPTVAPPVISPPGGRFTGSQIVTITDATPGAQIYYTTTGAPPTINSELYNSGTGITVTSNETISAIASATGYLQGGAVSAVFSSTANAANPAFSLTNGTYSGKQTLKITDATAGATIYYTVDGSTPTTSAPKYTGPFSVGVSEIVQAFATAPNLQPSSIISADYDIGPAYTFDFTQGFANAQASGQMQFNGSTDLDDFRLQLTSGARNQAGSAFYVTPVPISAFTTDFTFQQSNPQGDGITFTIQGDGPGALGVDSQGLGYKGIGKSVAIKFSIRGDLGQGNDSTGLYTNGADPTLPSVDLTNTGIKLQSGDYMNVHITYDGENLNMTITDAITLASWSNSWLVNIPQYIGAPTGYVGFTGSTGGSTSSQKVTSWTYLAGPPAVPNYPVGFDPPNGNGLLTLNGNAVLSGTVLELTTGKSNQTSSAYYTTPVDITSFSTEFDFKVNKGNTSTLGDGLTFVIQNAGSTALGGGGAGLGYAGMPNSVAIKFDFYNDAGEGNNSTGVYIDGATPTVPAINVTLNSAPMGSGDTIHVQITYDGTTLTWTLSTPGSMTNKIALNIPQTIGSNTAYVGFTGATGPESSAEKIVDWTFSGDQ